MLTPRIGRGHCVARRKLGQLDTSGGKEGTGADKKNFGSVVPQYRKGRIDLVGGVNAQDLDLKPAQCLISSR